jgi:hypothetical protein
MDGGATTTSLEYQRRLLAACCLLTDIGVQLGIVQDLDEGLNGLGRAIPSYRSIKLAR